MTDEQKGEKEAGASEIMVMSDETFYGEAAKPAEKPADGGGKPAPEDATPDPLAGLSGIQAEAPAAEPAEEPEPAAKTPESEPKPSEPEDTATTIKQEWDKERQKSDQERANAVKAMETIRAENAELKVLVQKALDAKQAEAAEGTAKEQARAEKEVEAVQEQIDALDASADAEQLSAALKAIARQALFGKKPAAGEAPEYADLRKQVATLNEKLAAKEKADKEAGERTAAETRAAADAAAKAAATEYTEAQKKGLDEPVVEDALSRAAKMFEEDGYTGETKPGLREYKRIVSLAFSEAKLASQGTGKAAKPKPKGPPVTPDTGAGGQSPATNKDIKEGSLKDVLAQLGQKHKGKIGK